MKSIFDKYGFAGTVNQHRYSTTSHPNLKSTVYELGRETYCIHCNERALHVQNDSGNNRDRNRYSKAGHRCICSGALSEMINNIAFSIVEPEHVQRITYKKLDRAVYIKAISKLSEHRLPLEGKDNSDHEPGNLTPLISCPSEHSTDRFVAIGYKEVARTASNSFNDESEGKKFINKVNAKIEELIESEVESLESRINELKLKSNTHKEAS